MKKQDAETIKKIRKELINFHQDSAKKLNEIYNKLGEMLYGKGKSKS